MAKTKVSEWDAVPGNNTDIDSINIAEGCAPSGINNAIRELMSQVKDFQQGTYSDPFNGPVNGTIGATTPAAGAFTTLTASSTATLNTLASSGATLTGGSINNMAIGGSTAAAGAFTTLAASGAVTLSGGTANGVAYLNGSKVLTTGSALTFDGANNLKLQTGAGVTSTLNLNNSDGNGTLSQINFGYTADPDHGNIKYTGDFIFSLSANSEQMRLTSTGLGIGTSSPGAKLTVSDTTSAAATAIATFVGQGSYSMGVQSVTNSASTVGNRFNFNIGSGGGEFSWSNNGGTLAYLNSSGNLGIGTSSPAAKLDVAGTSRQVFLVGNSYTEYRSVNGAGSAFAIQAYNALSYNWGLSNTLDKMILDSSGNLGLGVTPSAWLSGLKAFDIGNAGISANTSNTEISFNSNVYRDGSGNYVYKTTNLAARFVASAGSYQWYTAPSGTAGNAISFTQAMTLDASGNLAVGTTTARGTITNGGSRTAFGKDGSNNHWFRTNDNISEPNCLGYGFTSDGTAVTSHEWKVGGSTQMTLNASGNLGVGTSSPDSRLTVQTTGASNGTVASRSGLLLRADNISTGFASSRIQWTYGGLGTSTKAYIEGGVYGSDYLAFSGNGSSESARIDSSGNLGLGVTPSAWGSAWKSYQVKNSNVASSNYDLVHASNAYNNGTNWIYATTQTASLYYQNGNSHQWYNAPSGTAGTAISFTQAMTLDASGRLLVGTTTAGTSGVGVTVYGSGQGEIRLQNSSTGTGSSNGVQLVVDSAGGYFWNLNNTALIFGTNNLERARIDSSGNLLVGATSTVFNATFRVNGTAAVTGFSSGEGINISPAGNANYTAIRLLNNSGANTVGTIACSTTTTSYNTSSDYRLKENVQPMQNALAVVQQLNPVTYKWKADGSNGQGFIAHELQAVVPDCVTGEKDAVDEEGNPVYQGIDTSFLVATLTAAIQEQQAIINQLKARLDAANL